MSTASFHRESRSPADQLCSQDLTCSRISRQGSRCPATGLAETHLGNMNSLHQCVRSAGLLATERRQSLRAVDQQSLVGDMLQSGNVGVDDGGKWGQGGSHYGWWRVSRDSRRFWNGILGTLERVLRGCDERMLRRSRGSRRRRGQGPAILTSVMHERQSVSLSVCRHYGLRGGPWAIPMASEIEIMKMVISSMPWKQAKKPICKLTLALPQPDPLTLCTLEAQEVITKGAYWLPHAIY